MWPYFLVNHGFIVTKGFALQRMLKLLFCIIAFMLIVTKHSLSKTPLPKILIVLLKIGLTIKSGI